MTRYARVLLYGDLGTWKTVTALSWDSNARIFATDDGHVSALNHPDKIDYNRLDIISYAGRSQLLAEDFSSDHTTIVLDTVSEMIESYLDLLMDKATWGGKYREQLITNSKELKGQSNPAPADYQVIRNKWRPIANHFLTAPKDIFILSHENDPIEGLSKDMTRRPNMPSKAFKAIGQKCLVIGRMTRKPGREDITIDVRETNSRIVAKSRVNTITGEMSIDQFLSALKKWKEG